VWFLGLSVKVRERGGKKTAKGKGKGGEAMLDFIMGVTKKLIDLKNMC